MVISKKEIKSDRLKKFEQNLVVILKSKKYLEKELDKIRDKERKVRAKISLEKKAIILSNKAKELRALEK